MLRPRLSLALVWLLAASTAGLAQNGDDAAYRAATGLLHRGMPEQAAAEYRAFLRDHPSHDKAESARYGLAVCLTRLARWNEAAAELDALAGHRFEFAPDVLLLRAQCSLHARDLAGAVRSLQSLLDDHPGFAQADAAAVMLGEALLSEGRRDLAAAVLARFERDWPKSSSRPRAEFLLATLDVAAGRDSDAAERLARLRKNHPGSDVDRQAQLAEAQCRHRLAVGGNQREAERAATLYRSIARGAPHDLIPEAMLGLAQLKRASGDAQEAGRILDELLSRFGADPIAVAATIERARAYLDDDKAERALATLEPVLRRPDAPAEAVYWAAKSELRLKRFAACAARLEQASRQHAGSPLLPEILFDRAVALARDGNSAAASTAYADIRTRFPNHALAAEALAARASLALAAGDPAEATELCNQFLVANTNHPRVSSVQLVLAEASSLAGRDDEAAAEYAKFIAASAGDPRAVDAAVRRGLALARAGKSDQAAQALEAALAGKDPIDDALVRSAQAVLADAAIARSDWPAAEKWLRSLSRLNASPDSTLKLGITLQRQGRAEDSIDLFRRVIDEFPQDPAAIQARFERAQVLVEQGKLDPARGDFEAVLAAERGSLPHRFSVHCLRHLASIAARQNRAADAANLLAQVADSPDAGSTASDALYERGAALLSAGQYEEADAALARFLSASPSHPRTADASAQRAIATSRLGHYEQALTQMEAAEASAAKVRPEVLSALNYEKAWALKTLGRAEEARAAYEHLLEKSLSLSLESHASLDLAQLLIAANDHSAATPLLTRALKSADKLPADEAARLAPHALYLRGVCEFKLERPADSAATLEDLLVRFPGSDIAVAAQLLAGQALLKSNKPEAAAKHLESAIAANPPAEILAPALLCLGEAHAAAQQWDKSRAAFELHVSQFPKSEFGFQARFGIAWALEHEGHHAEAMTTYREVVSNHNGPTAARAQFQVGECCFALKQYDEAVRELLKVDILYAYPEWSAAALYEAGRCFVQLNKLAEARAQFMQVTERFKETQWARLAAEELHKAAAAAPSTLPGRSAVETR